MSQHEGVTLVEEFEPLVPFDELSALMRDLLARIERDGVRGLASMNFWTEPSKKRLGAVITFTDPRDFKPHTEMLAGWPEFARFIKMVRIVEIRVHGILPPEIEEWVRSFDGPMTVYPQLVAGFVR